MRARFALDSAMLAAPRLTIVTMALAAPPARRGRAQDASPWDKQPHAQARLIAGSVMKSADAAYLRAGVEIRLDAGWKTYWREPGDSGVRRRLIFPAPRTSSRSPLNGRRRSALLTRRRQFHRLCRPGRAAAAHCSKDAAKHSSVHLKLNYAVCGNLCVAGRSNA